jgi:hypothetical protein
MLNTVQVLRRTPAGFILSSLQRTCYQDNKFIIPDGVIYQVITLHVVQRWGRVRNNLTDNDITDICIIKATDNQDIINDRYYRIAKNTTTFTKRSFTTVMKYIQEEINGNGRRRHLNALPDHVVIVALNKNKKLLDIPYNTHLFNGLMSYYSPELYRVATEALIESGNSESINDYFTFTTTPDTDGPIVVDKPSTTTGWLVCSTDYPDDVDIY